jgi:hypothetical protein
MRTATMDPGVTELLTRLLEGQTEALGDDLVGSYLFGSAVMGDYDPGISDVDTVAVLRSDPTTTQLASLARLHSRIVEETPEWEDRVEVVYLSSRALATFRTASSAAARISPGEPFHAIEVDHTWLIDWYPLREVGVALSGPPIASVVPVISREEYVGAVRRHMSAWSDWTGALPTRAEQAYVILTMCRGLRTWRTAEHISKREAARWACEVVPEYADLIRDAVVWRAGSRTGSPIDGAATRDVTRRSVIEVLRLVDAGGTDRGRRGSAPSSRFPA